MNQTINIRKPTIDACITAFHAMNKITAAIKTAPTLVGVNNDLYIEVPEATKNIAVVANAAAIDALAGLLDALREHLRTTN
jgi:hypothetical protein